MYFDNSADYSTDEIFSFFECTEIQCLVQIDFVFLHQHFHHTKRPSADIKPRSVADPIGNSDVAIHQNGLEYLLFNVVFITVCVRCV